MRYVMTTVLSLALASPILVGCDREVAHQDKTSQNPITGTTTTKDETTYQRPDGSTYTNQSKTSSSGTTNTNP